MLFAASKRGALLIKPRPLSGYQIKAEIKGFLLIYRLFLYQQWFFQNIEKGWRKIFEKKIISAISQNDENYKNIFPPAFFNILKGPLLLQKQTIPQKKALVLSVLTLESLRAWHHQEDATPPCPKRHILLIFYILVEGF